MGSIVPCSIYQKKPEKICRDILEIINTVEKTTKLRYKPERSLIYTIPGAMYPRTLMRFEKSAEFPTIRDYLEDRSPQYTILESFDNITISTGIMPELGIMCDWYFQISGPVIKTIINEQETYARIIGKTEHSKVGDYATEKTTSTIFVDIPTSTEELLAQVSDSVKVAKKYNLPITVNTFVPSKA